MKMDLNEKIAREIAQLAPFEFFGLTKLLEVEGEEFQELWEGIWDKIYPMSRWEKRRLLRILRATEKRTKLEEDFKNAAGPEL